MTPTERPISHKALLVDDDAAVRDMMALNLDCKGFEVVSANSPPMNTTKKNWGVFLKRYFAF
jgi:hypothetical protein